MIEQMIERTSSEVEVVEPNAVYPWRPFPVEVLPETVSSFIVEVAAANGCDPAVRPILGPTCGEMPLCVALKFSAKFDATLLLPMVKDGFSENLRRAQESVPDPATSSRRRPAIFVSGST